MTAVEPRFHSVGRGWCIVLLTVTVLMAQLITASGIATLTAVSGVTGRLGDFGTDSGDSNTYTIAVIGAVTTTDAH